jgi:geranylgeranyl diphosphate synthase type II
MSRPFDLAVYLELKRRHVDRELRRILTPGTAYPPVIHTAMRYSVFAGGKRIRPILVLASHDLAGGKSKTVLATACAVEILHTYSLIHDDLPCMDDDDLRRGKPTLHKAFNEAVAVLAGDALNALAFEVLSECQDRRVPREIARAIGSRGMIGGQVMDVETEGRKVSVRELRYIHTHKTGRLIQACAVAGALEAQGSPAVVADCAAWGADLGLAFQIVDDILNIKGSEKNLGKRVGSDARKQKNTWPSVFGLAPAEREARRLVRRAQQRLSRYPRSAALLALANLIVNRIS